MISAAKIIEKNFKRLNMSKPVYVWDFKASDNFMAPVSV